jgi:hypothetical protein
MAIKFRSIFNLPFCLVIHVYPTATDSETINANKIKGKEIEL